MREIRLHGIGGMGTVKAGEIIVRQTVKEGKYGASMPFFGFERQGAPVTSFVRLDDKPIRPKNKVYYPDCVVILDPSLLVSSNVFEGFGGEAIFVLNTPHKSADTLKLNTDAAIKRIVVLDATSIALDILGKAIPNTIMLGAFARATNWVDPDGLEQTVAEFFGKENGRAFRGGYEQALVIDI